MNKQQPALKATHTKTPWYWIPSLYFTEGLPYAAIVMLSAIMYKKLGVSNAELAFFTAWLYLPWMIKPLWSPFVELFKTKRWWIVGMQFLLGTGLAGVALSLPVDNYLQYTMAFFWLLAFSSATHDIAADGYYMSALDNGQQAFFVGIRSTFYRLASLTGQGLIVFFAGTMEAHYDVRVAWQMSFFLLSGIVIIFALYHAFILPKVETEQTHEHDTPQRIAQIFPAIAHVFATFFQKQHIILYLAFILLYRLGEAQLGKIATLFFLDPRAQGGLGLSTTDIGIMQGFVGVIALLLGGIIGGILISRHGLKYWIWWMALAINVPNIVYVFMAWQQPTSLLLIQAFIVIEQFGYGFGFTAFMLYLIYIAQGEFKTAHYALATGFMAAGMMIPSMFSGWIQEELGYKFFFIWVMIACLPAFYIISRLPLDKTYGRSHTQTE